MRRLSWITWVDTKCHHKCLYKRETEVDTQTEGDVITEAGIGEMQSGKAWRLFGYMGEEG